MMILTLMSGLGMFLCGIKMMGDGLEMAAGNRMKHFLEILTRNKLMAVVMGAFVTAVIQSSSATTVMVVGFVNAGLLQLSQAIGVVMGANIGTTVTSLLLSFELDFAVIFMALGAVFQLAGSKPAVKLGGQITMGLGLLFMGMDAMSAAMEPLRDWSGFQDMMTFASNPVIGVLVGAAVTALLQSSAASIGILQSLAATGAVSLNASLFILFGQNIGTCVTCLIAATGANVTAKRTAVVHLLFNFIGTMIFLVLSIFCPLADWVELLADSNIRLQIAVAHVLFNVTTTLLLLPLSGVLEKLACLLVRGKDKPVEPKRLQYFDERLLSTPPVAVAQLFREVRRMADISLSNVRFALDYFASPKGMDCSEFENREEVIDYLNAAITQELIELKGLQLSSGDMHLTGSLFHVVNDLERIGDHATNIMEIGQARKKEKLRFSNKAEHEIEGLSATVLSMLEKSVHIVDRQITDVEVVGEVFEMESHVDETCEALADRHMDRVKAKKCEPRNGMLYLDMLNNLERIADHANNLASSVDRRSASGPERLLW